jgi:hypothetical protein
MCLNFIVAKDRKNGDPIISADKVQTIVDKMNTIWGCGSNEKHGPCCIKFTFDKGKNFAPESIGDLNVPKGAVADANQGTFNDLRFTRSFNDLFDRGASQHCWNIAIIGELISTEGTVGVTVPKTQQAHDKRGTAAGLRDPSGAGNFGTDDLGTILAHEVGHALGVADGPGTSENGVTSHSKHKKNLMAPFKDGSDLNLKQCEKARASEWVRPTRVACDCEPTETPV